MDFTKGEILEMRLRLIAFAVGYGPANRGRGYSIFIGYDIS